MEGGDIRVSNIDQRIVQMKFDNSQFEDGAATSLKTLDKLNKSLQLQGAAKGLLDIGAAAGKVSLGGIAEGVDQVASKFGAMKVIGVTALADLTEKVVDFGIEMTKKFTIDPIKDGFANYETQINAVQTILANTAAEGTKIGDVNKVLAELNTYANQTVYNFSDMTKNIGTFTAAGVDLKTSAESIKGIANLAAMSGANSEQASGAMYQLSQAIATGTVKLQDWNSVVNAGLGGKTFQDALENTARASGVAIDSIVKKAGGFRNSLQEGWLTSDILTKTLAQFTGDLSAAQLKAMGFTAQQAKQIQAMGQTAVDAATKIKTMSQLTQALKEEVGTAYAAIFKTLFGDIGQATDLFSSIHNVAENALTGPIYALNTVLQGWSKLGSRTALIDGLKFAFEDLAAVVKPIIQAFREIFPPTTAKQLYDMTTGFRDFFEKLKIGGTTADELKRTFAGVFAIFKLGWDVVKSLGSFLGDLFGQLTKNSGGFLDLTARAGDWIVKLKDAVEKGQDLTRFFDKLKQDMEIPILLFQAAAQYVKDLFDRFDGASKATQAIDTISEKLGPIGQLSQMMNKVWADILDHLSGVLKYIDPIIKKFEDFAQQFGQSIANAFKNLNYQDVLQIFNAGLLTGLIALVKKFVDKFKSGESDGGLGGFVDTIKETFEGLTKTLETMQGTLKATTLLEIAAAIGILTISVTELAKVNAPGLAAASGAITVMFTQLVTSLAIFQKFVGTEGFVKMPFLMGSLILLAGAIDVLTIAVQTLGQMDWETLRRGLTGVSVLITVIAGDVRLMGDPEHMISAGLGLIALSKGIRNLAEVVVNLSGLDWSQMARGLAGVAGILTSLALFSMFAEANIAGISQGAGIVLLAYGIKILVDSIKQFSGFSWTEIAKGLLTLAGALGAIGGALYLIPPSSVFSAAGVLIVASSLGLIGDAIVKLGNLSYTQIAKGLVAMAFALAEIAGALYLLPPSTVLSAAAIFITAASLGVIGDALGKMGGMSWTEIAKSLIELAGALTIVAFALVLMVGSLPGSAALLVMAGAMRVLLPVLQAFADMTWEDIAQSLVMLAGVFVILAGAGILLAPVTPILLALGSAITLLGVGILAAGAGMLLFSAALTALSIAGTAGTAVLVAMVTAMLGLLPLAGKEIGLAIVAFAGVITEGGPAITKALVTILTSILDAMNQMVPKIVDVLLHLLTVLLQKAAEYVPQMVVAGAKLVIGILNGLAAQLPGMISAATNLIIAFLNGITINLPRIIQAGFNLIIKFINGMADAIVKNSPALAQAGVHMAQAIVEGMLKGIASGAGSVVDAVGNMATGALKSAGHLLGIHSPSVEFHKLGAFSAQGYANGITDTVGIVSDASANMGKTAILSMTKTLSTLSDALPNTKDLQPVISPVLDLTAVKQGASQIPDMFKGDPISVEAAASRIASIYQNDYLNTPNATNNYSTPPTRNGPPITFIQNNNSPTALSSADIYRQTKNQLSQARGLYVFNDGSTG